MLDANRVLFRYGIEKWLDMPYNKLSRQYILLPNEQTGWKFMLKKYIEADAKVRCIG